MDKVSIIIPFYNCPYIDRAIKSALNQTYSNIEVIVVNDGSILYTDKVKSFLHSIRYIEKANGGTASALNAGIKSATGDYFTWLSSDDIYDPKKVERQMKKMKETGARISYMSYFLIDENDRVTSPKIGVHHPTRELFCKHMMKGCFINGCTVMADMNIFNEMGMFDESLPYTHDYDLWLRILPKYHFYYIDEPLVYYRVHDQMGTKRHAEKINDEIKYVQQTHYGALSQFLQDLKPANNGKGFTGFFLNTVPKSGTHLLKQILLGIPGAFHDPYKDMFEGLPAQLEDHLKVLSTIKNNEFLSGHIYYSKEWHDMLENFKMKQILLIRDPRDVAVSLSYFIDRLPQYPLYEKFTKTGMTQKEKILDIIQGVQLKTFFYPNIHDYFSSFWKWNGKNRVLTVKYEDFMTSKEACNKAMVRLSKFIWEDAHPPLAHDQLIECMGKNINPKRSPTFRQGKIGSWRKEFDEEMKEVFKSVAGDLLIELGYETDKNW
ncbi:glycosyltransferase [Fictibacillus sp. Mic-4]|uniref:glycosyltransferase n=1 Tax=Fictibacillus sp. Mic-4 TaxID=3132826 RepID=UPI003CEE0BD7